MFEKVNMCHPDKVMDRIAGAITDLGYEKNDNLILAGEGMIGHGECSIILETNTNFEEQEIEEIVKRISQQDNIKLNLKVVPQDKHLAENQSKEIKCGDNGIFKGVPLTQEEKTLSRIAREICNIYNSDGKYILNSEDNTLIICQSKCKDDSKLQHHYEKEGFENVIVNPLGYWDGGTNTDCGTCIQEDSLIYTTEGLKPIRTLSSFDKVYTQDGIANITTIINNGCKKTKIIKDEYGGEIEATDNHPFRVFDGKQIIWKNCEDLRIGDILLKRKLNHIKQSNEKIKKCRIIKYPIYSDSGKHDKLYERKIKIDRDFAYLMGWLVGDGNNTSKDRLTFYYGNLKEKEHLRLILEKVFGKEMIKSYEYQEDRFYILSKGLVETLINEGMVNALSYNKSIPTFILESSNAIKGAFISGLFDADGYVKKELTKGRKKEHLRISLSTVSKKLAQQVKTLLYSMGINSTILTCKKLEDIKILDKRVIETHTPYQVTIRGLASQKKFVHNCLFRLDYKQQECLSLTFDRFCYDSDSYYLCSLVTDLLNKDTKKKNKYFPKHTDLKDRNGYKEQTIDYILDMYAEYKGSNEYQTIKYIYDNLKMVKIKDIKESESIVYDITIDEDSHSFIANDYIVHNCNRKLGSDMAQSVTGGGLIFKDTSKADVSVNIYCFLKAQQLNKVVEGYCAIGDTDVSIYINENDGTKTKLLVPYKEIVNIAKQYINQIGGFEKFAEWGLV